MSRKISILCGLITSSGRTTACPAPTCMTTQTSCSQTDSTTFSSIRTLHGRLLFSTKATHSAPASSIRFEVVSAALTSSNLLPAAAINPAAADTGLGSTTGQTAPTIQINGGFQRNQGGVGSASNYIHTFNNYQISDDAFWTHGTHTLKFGVDIEREQYNFIANQNKGGRWNFPNLTAYFNNQSSHFEAGIPSTVVSARTSTDHFRGIRAG